MATQGYGTAPGRNSMNAVGTSLPRSVTTKPVPLILSAMKQSATPTTPAFKGKTK